MHGSRMLHRSTSSQHAVDRSYTGDIVDARVEES
jgi:hypothetical protein